MTELLLDSCLVGRGAKGPWLSVLGLLPIRLVETSSETEGSEAWIGSFPFFLFTYMVLRVARLWTLMGHQVLASSSHPALFLSWPHRMTS